MKIKSGRQNFSQSIKGSVILDETAVYSEVLTDLDTSTYAATILLKGLKQ